MNPDDPRELNRYVYTADNPVNATDPTGRGLYDYRAITEAVAQNTQNVAGELGSEVQLALGRVASEFLAIEARQIERDAVALWEFAHNQKFPYRKRGELGAGLGRYEGVDGANHGIAAFNDIGLQGGPRDAPFTADQRAAYEELHAIMERELIGRGYEIVHRSEFVDVTRAQAGHEEDFLMQAYRERASVTAIGSINVTGVPQRTICSRCNFSHAGGTGTADEFVALISEEREIQAVVAGHDLAVAEGLLPLIP